jgi:hypothetical protein
VVMAVSMLQANTSVRWGSGANGELGLCTPAPWPCGTPSELLAEAPEEVVAAVAAEAAGAALPPEPCDPEAPGAIGEDSLGAGC